MDINLLTIRAQEGDDEILLFIDEIHTLVGAGKSSSAMDAAKRLIAKLGYDPLFGARPVKRVIQREVVNELSKRILASEVTRDKPILIDAEGERLTYSN